MSNQSLLDKAKQLPTRHKTPKEYTDEQIELVEAWINDEISLSQMVRISR